MNPLFSLTFFFNLYYIRTTDALSFFFWSILKKTKKRYNLWYYYNVIEILHKYIYSVKLAFVRIYFLFVINVSKVARLPRAIIVNLSRQSLCDKKKFRRRKRHYRRMFPWGKREAEKYRLSQKRLTILPVTLCKSDLSVPLTRIFKSKKTGR